AIEVDHGADWHGEDIFTLGNIDRDADRLLLKRDIIEDRAVYADGDDTDFIVKAGALVAQGNSSAKRINAIHLRQRAINHHLRGAQFRIATRIARRRLTDDFQDDRFLACLFLFEHNGKLRGRGIDSGPARRADL